MEELKTMSSESKNVFEIIQDEVWFLMSTRNYYSALLVTLSLPAICASIDSGVGSTHGRDGELYRKWLDQYTLYKEESGGKGLVSFSNKTVYQIRCKLMHNGRMIKQSRDAEDFDITFVAPSNLKITSKDGKGYSVMIVSGRKMLRINIDEFILNIFKGVNQWMKNVKGDKEFINYVKDAAKFGVEDFGPGFKTNIPTIH